jgi:peroxiredoxin
MTSMTRSIRPFEKRRRNNPMSAKPFAIVQREVSRYLVLVLLLCLPACTESPSSSSSREDSPNPPAAVVRPGTDFGNRALEISGQDANGAAVRLSNFRGKVVLVDFWATWCGPCLAEIPLEKQMVRKFKDRPFAVLGISRDRQLDDLKKFLDRDNLPWPNIYDATGSILKMWKIEALPTFVLIDHQGIIVGRWVGGGQMEDIEGAVDRAVRNATKEQIANPN